MPAIENWLDRHRRAWLAALSVLAAIRIGYLCLAYPIFTNVDEPQQFDVVVQYANGRWPLGIGPLEVETRETIFRYGSVEYLVEKNDPRFSPQIIAGLARLRQSATMPADYFTIPDHELHQPPVYYALAGLVYRTARGMGVRPFHLPFIVRLIDVPIIVLTVLAVHRLAAMVVPRRLEVVLGAPLVVAFFPQDALCQIGSDSMSAAVCGWALIWLLAPMLTGRITLAGAVLAGLGAAAAVMTKWTNLPIVAVAAIAAIFVLRSGAPGRGRVGAVLIASVLIPIGLWCARCHAALGDFTATGPTVRYLGWTPRPLSDWFEHPIFRAEGWNPLQADRGMFRMLHETVITFWRGEFVWYRERLCSPQLDLSYYLVTLFGLGLALLAFRRGAGCWRTGLAVLLAYCAAAFAELVVLSIRYDFGQCIYPSTAEPYMSSGRLILGALAPLCVCVLLGLSELWQPLARHLSIVFLLAVMCVMMTAVELDAARPALGARSSALAP